MLRTKPYRFQRVDARRVIRRFGGRALIGHHPGLGKTFTSLYIADKLGCKRIIVVCPAIAKEHWKREAALHLNRPATVLWGQRPDNAVRRKKHIYIVNYDILGHPKEEEHPLSWRKLLRRFKPDLVVLDEIHWIKEPKAKRSKWCKFLCKGVKYVLGLSGTPMPNRPIELWYPLKIIKPDLFPSRYDYAYLYCALHQGPRGLDYSGCSNPEMLNEVLLSNVMVRRRKEDVIKDLPEKTRITIPIQLNKTARKEYEFAEKKFLQWLIVRFNQNRANKAFRSEAFLRMQYLKRLAAQLKLKQAREWIDEFLIESQEKLLVFGIHRKVLRPMRNHYDGKAVLIDGSVSRQHRQKIIDTFNTDKQHRLFFGNLIAAGQAWSCRTASTVLFLEIDWVPGNHLQAEDRVHGIKRGTGKPVFAYYMVVEDTIEENLVIKLQKKTKVISAVIDGHKIKDPSAFDVLLKEYYLLAKQKKGKKSR